MLDLCIQPLCVPTAQHLSLRDWSLRGAGGQPCGVIEAVELCIVIKSKGCGSVGFVFPDHVFSLHVSASMSWNR